MPTPTPNKSRDNQAHPARPLMPTLANNRNVKSPITPRLATHHLNPATPAPKSVRSNTPSTIKSGATREDLCTPVKALLSNNITPRSSSRRSRTTDSLQSTPNGTPNSTPTATRPTSVAEGAGSSNGRRPLGLSGLGISSNGNTKSRPGSVVVGGYSGTTSPSIGSAGLGSMFFHAGGIPPSQEPTPTVKKSPVFFYANGQLEDVPSRPLSSPSPTLSAVSTRSHKSQFFRADGTTDEDIPPVPPLPSPPILTPSPMPFQGAPMFRPSSPTKDSFNFHLSYRKGASQVMRPDNRPKAVSILPPTALNPSRQRSTSSGLPKAQRHGRTSSLSSIESSTSSRKPSLAALETCGLTPLHPPNNLASITSSPVQYASAPPTAGLPSPVLEAEDPISSPTPLQSLLRSRQGSISTPILSVPQSPTKLGAVWPPQNAPQTTEAVMNARVERKIQDLEISNSSLMAINRSLEKEVRRQNKELRRFRRLSRAGRLSGISVDSLANDGDDYDEDAESGSMLLPALSEEDEDDLASDDDDSRSTNSSSSAESDSKKLEKDSKRLQLDLSKHRDLLVDSQKMNQSLKRCMAWTEDLIREGKRALEYKVNVSDVKLGGRVLDRENHAEEEEEESHYEADHSLLSTWTASPMPILENSDGILGLDIGLGRKSWQSEEADSGIELESARGSRLIAGEGLEELQHLVSDLTVYGQERPEAGVS